MGLFSKLFKGPEIDMEKSNANAKKMRALFMQSADSTRRFCGAKRTRCGASGLN